MKKIILLTFSLILCVTIDAQTTLIPDSNFEQALINLGYDFGAPDGIIPTSNIDTITSLNVIYQNISDLTGIQDFSALRGLDCSHNPITMIDVSNNNNLDTLNIRYAQLTTLDVSQNVNLVELDCYHNQLDSLNITQNLLLNHLECDWNNLTSLDVSQNIYLKKLSAYNNLLSSIDVSNNTLLEALGLAHNQLTEIDISNNLLLSFFVCSYNQIDSLDLSQATLLTTLDCAFNSLVKLDLSNNTMLYSFNCDYCNLYCLNANNGPTPNFNYFWVKNNPNLNCVEVDDPNFWNGANWLYIDTAVQINNNCNNLCSVVGVDENEYALEVNLYPNPVINTITFEFNNKIDATVEITNVQGQLLTTKIFKRNIIGKVDVRFLPKGIYFAKITTSEGQKVLKFLKN